MDSANRNLPADLAPLTETSVDSSGTKDLDQYQHASQQATQAFAGAEAAAASGNEEQAIHQYLRCAAAAESAHEWYLVALSCERVGEFLLNPQPPTDVGRALRMLRRAVAAYEQSGLFSEARAVAYRVALLRLWRIHDVELTWFKRIELSLYWLMSGFGLRPLRVIATSLVVIFIYGIIYWVGGGAVDLQSQQSVGLSDSIYFSGITFATVGYGDLIPAVHARWIALSEGLLGAFLLGFFVVVLSHRLARI
jgi:hypothetical protein